MDNLPGNPSDQSGSNDNSNTVPPPFGSNFHPHTEHTNSNPPNPPQSLPHDNNTVDPVQSWVAQHEQRDASGRFVPTEHLKNPDPNTPNSPNPAPPGAGLPLPIQITENNKYSERNDPPMVDLKVTNPVTYFKKWVTKFFKNQDIDIHLKIKPFATIGLILAFTTVSGVSFNIGRMFFPNSSPILHRAITLQGEVQKSESGQYYLSLPDNTLWTLRPKATNINLNNVLNKQVLVKGNMTAEANVIEVKEVITFDEPTPNPVLYAPIQQPATNSAGQSTP